MPESKLPSAPIFGRFRLLERASGGASGDVFRAFDDREARTVAVKILRKDQEDPRGEERFTREARLLARVDDPHVVRYVTHGHEKSIGHFLVVEWLEGEDLAQRRRRQPLSGPEVLAVSRQVALGLAALHDVGVVHRDIKPSNVFLSPGARGPRVRLIDLGIAWSRSESSITQHGAVVGTPHYMSPEQIMSPETISPRSDLFSLGTMIFELVSGMRAFDGDTPLATVAKIALGDPPMLSSLLSEVPPALDAVVARAMAKKPEDRWENARALADALETVPPFAAPARNYDEDAPTRALPGVGLSPLGLGAIERRIVTALFMEGTGPRDVELSRAPFEELVRGRGGVSHALSRFGLCGIFGATHSTGSEALEAARTALVLRSRLPSTARLGIVTARSNVATGALPEHSIDAALRTIAAEASDSITLDEATKRLLGDAFSVREAGPHALLEGERQLAEGPNMLLGLTTPFVGRDSELSELEARFERCRRERRATSVVVTGEPGSGKSRLRHELRQRLDAKSPAPFVLLGRGSVMTEGTAYGLLGSAIRHAFNIQEGEPRDDQHKKLGSTIRKGSTTTLLPLLAQIASVDERVATFGADRALVNDRLREAFERWLASTARDRPVVFLLEDLQWGDLPSIALVDSALRNLPDAPIFVVGFTRPEPSPRFSGTWTTREEGALSLGGLSTQAATELVRRVLGSKADLQLTERIVARADGNAFFLEELIRAARDSDRNLDFSLPETVLGLAQARLDALGPAGKRLLLIASVFGETCWKSAITALSPEYDEKAITPVWDALAAREVIARRTRGRFVDEPEYVFRHAILRDAAYALLNDDDRRLAHLRAGEWLAQKGERDPLVLARHFDLGGDRKRARVHFRRAAEQALFGNDWRGVVACAERGIEGGAEGEEFGLLRLLLAEAQRWIGRLPEACEAATDAISHLERGSAAYFHAVRECVASAGRLGRMDLIETLAERTLEVVARPEAKSAQVSALVPASIHMLYAGDVARGELLRAAIDRLAGEAPLDPFAKARLHQMRAAFANHNDDLETGIEEHERALASFAEAQDQRGAALASSNFGFALLELGRLEEAEPALRRALSVASRLGLKTIGPLATQNLGLLLARLGRADEALECHRNAAVAFATQGDARLSGSSRVHIALLLIARGDLDEATAEARVVLEGSSETVKVGAYAALSRIALIRGELDEAQRLADAAEALLERLGVVEEFEVSARLAFIDATIARGEVALARAALRRAWERVQKRAEKLREPKNRASFIDGIPEHLLLRELLGRYAVDA